MLVGILKTNIMKPTFFIFSLAFFCISAISQPYQPKAKTKSFMTKYTGYTAEIPRTNGHAREKFTWVKWDPQSQYDLVLKLQIEIYLDQNTINDSKLIGVYFKPYAKDQLYEIFDDNRLKQNGGKYIFLPENVRWKLIHTIHGVLHETRQHSRIYQ